MCEQAADRFQRQPEIGADFLTGHAQVEFRGGETTVMETHGKAEQECCEAFFCRAFAEQNHQACFLCDFTAHQAEQLMLQIGYGRCQFFKVLERDFADCRGLQCLGRTDVLVAFDAVQANHFAGKMEAHHLFCAIRTLGIGLDRTCLYHIDAAEPVTGLKDMSATLKGAVALHDGIELIDITAFETKWQTELGKSAVFTCDLQFVQGNYLTLGQWASLLSAGSKELRCILSVNLIQINTCLRNNFLK